MLRDMMDMGHEVGLHFSKIDHPERDRSENVRKLIEQDANILSSIIGKKIKVFGFHNPETDGFQIEVNGLINSYSRRFLTMPCTLQNQIWRGRMAALSVP